MEEVLLLLFRLWFCIHFKFFFSCEKATKNRLNFLPFLFLSAERRLKHKKRGKWKVCQVPSTPSSLSFIMVVQELNKDLLSARALQIRETNAKRVVSIGLPCVPELHFQMPTLSPISCMRTTWGTSSTTTAAASLSRPSWHFVGSQKLCASCSLSWSVRCKCVCGMERNRFSALDFLSPQPPLFLACVLRTYVRTFLTYLQFLPVISLWLFHSLRLDFCSQSLGGFSLHFTRDKTSLCYLTCLHMLLRALYVQLYHLYFNIAAPSLGIFLRILLDKKRQNFTLLFDLPSHVTCLMFNSISVLPTTLLHHHQVSEVFLRILLPWYT